jgi:hypothetical protein
MFKIRNPFRKEKKEEPVFPPIQQLQQVKNVEALNQEKQKPEMEILMAKIDALKLQYELLAEKISSIEKMIREIYQMAKEEA